MAKRKTIVPNSVQERITIDEFAERLNVTREDLISMGQSSDFPQPGDDGMFDPEEVAEYCPPANGKLNSETNVEESDLSHTATDPDDSTIVNYVMIRIPVATCQAARAVSITTNEIRIQINPEMRQAMERMIAGHNLIQQRISPNASGLMIALLDGICQAIRTA